LATYIKCVPFFSAGVLLCCQTVFVMQFSDFKGHLEGHLKDDQGEDALSRVKALLARLRTHSHTCTPGPVA
jgi:hypothetical protein